MPTLSLCLIVKNGGKALHSALASARPFMDEMVVVDTGSTDDSRQVAAALGAKLFEFPWCDDFSAARNCSLAHATSDWIFWMDADDELPADSGQELRRQMAAHPGRDAAFWVTVEERSRAESARRDRVMGHAHVKLFPRHEAIRFRYRVHEQVAPAIRDLGLPIKPTRAVVHHAHANRTPEGEQSRLERNLRLGLLDLAEHPDDPFVWLHLGTTYLFQPGGLELAVDYLSRSAAGLKSGSTTQLNAYLYLGQAHGTRGDRDRERETYQQALAAFPDDAVLLMRLGAVHENTGRLSEAADCYRTALARGKVRSSAVHLRRGHVQAALRLGSVLAKAGRPRQAESAFIQFLAKFPDETPIRQALLELQAKFPSIIS